LGENRESYQFISTTFDTISNKSAIYRSATKQQVLPNILMPTNRTNNEDMKISLIVPIKNESDSIGNLIVSINRQVFRPVEVILVDGGSTDDTIEIAERLTVGDSRFKLIKTPQASPGKGRNIGAENASFNWIAFTDAGIELDKCWLEKLVEKVIKNPEIDVVYGNFTPAIDSLFEKCLMITFVSPQNKIGIREQSMISILLKKQVWEKVGGFPDLRAAEDNIFMDAVEENNFNLSFAPEAMVYWKLSPDLVSTFKKFTLYSKHNVQIGRQWEWHYGIARQYLFVILFIVFAVVHSSWWLLGIVLWLFARTAKRIFAFRYEFGFAILFNPVLFFGTAIMILTIDLATFVGWAQAIIKK
jgi:glycosyltransferase involved in cell wall biosynthesis